MRATGLARSTDAVFYYEVGEREERQFGKVVMVVVSNGVLVIRCAQWKLRRQTTRVGGGLAYRCLNAERELVFKNLNRIKI